MPTFTVSGTVTVSCWTVVEAATETEAKEIAAEREVAGLCHMPFDAPDDEAWHIETDGDPTVIDANGH